MTDSPGEILFLAHRIPFPPDRGDKIRSHHILKALARLAPVHVGTFADDEPDANSETELAAVSRSHHLARRSKPLALAGVRGLLTGQPVSVVAFADAGLHRWVKDTLQRRQITIIYAFSSQMAQYIPKTFAGRVVMDFVDVDSAKFEAYVAKSAQPMRSIYAREARLLARYEAAIAHRAVLSLFVTAQEAALFRSRLDPATRASASVEALGNGIDCALYDPDLVDPAPELTEGEGPILLFSGQMDYPPNVAAVVRFATRVMPLIRTDLPGARFEIIGRCPTTEVMALEGIPNTRVRGRVEDMRPWLAGADLVVAPLEIARGVQNKVLEAMAMRRPVLVSPEAATGIAGRDGIELAIEASDEGLAARALALLAAPRARAEMGAAARHFVLANQSWPTMLAGLPAIVGFKQADARHAA